MVHRFTFLAKDDMCYYAFDLYADVSEEEVLTTHLKKTDTKVLAVIVNMSGRPRPAVARLADEIGITILGPADIDAFFSLNDTDGRVGRASALGIAQ